MANQKNFYYVGVQTDKGMQLVTHINYANKSAQWKADEKPLAMKKYEAEELRFGLCLNFHFAVVINCHFEMEEQYFMTK